MRRTLAIAGLIVTAIALAAISWLRAGREVPVELLHPTVWAADWSTYLEAVRAAPARPAEAAPVVIALEGVHRALPGL